MTNPTTAEMPDRRVASAVASALAEQRLNHMELEVGKVGITLSTLDTKFDNLRRDLFENSPFVTHKALEDALKSRDEDINELKQARKDGVNTTLVIVGLICTVLIAIGSPILVYLLTGGNG